MPDFDIAEHYRSMTRQLLARNELCGSMFSHGDIIGAEAENIVRDMLRAVLPPNVGVNTGQVVSVDGDVSPQADVIIHHSAPGSIVGQNEGGQKLVRLEAVIGVLEIKRCIGRGTVAKIQDYCQRLHEYFVDAGRESRWFQWAFSFTSEKTSSEILSELGSTHDPVRSVGRLIVLDCSPSAAELLALERTHPVRNARTGRLTGSGLAAFARASRVPRSVFFTRTNNPAYGAEDVGDTPVLLAFASELEQRIIHADSAPNMLLSDHLE